MRIICFDWPGPKQCGRNHWFANWILIAFVFWRNLCCAVSSWTMLGSVWTKAKTWLAAHSNSFVWSRNIARPNSINTPIAWIRAAVTWDIGIAATLRPSTTSVCSTIWKLSVPATGTFVALRCTIRRDRNHQRRSERFTRTYRMRFPMTNQDCRPTMALDLFERIG